MKVSLSMRIYALGLLQTAVVLVGIVALARLQRPEPPDVHRAQDYALADSVEEHLDEPQIVADLLEQATEIGLEATVFDEDGRRVASSVDATAGACRPDGTRAREGKALPQSKHAPPPAPPRDEAQTICYVLPLRSAAGLGEIELRRVLPATLSPLAPPIVLLTLITVAVVSWLLLRSLVRPLETLRRSAAALGSGDLGTRTGIERNDELGDVADAFDTMAARIESLVQGERELIANISHELRTPLARIRVAFDLASESRTSEGARLALEDIGEDLDELDQLIKNVLDDARAGHGAASEPGTPRLQVQRMAAAEPLTAAIQRFIRTYPDRQLGHDVDVHPEATLQGDGVLLRRMIDNILDNAVRYSTRKITLRARGDRSGVLLIVIRDLGIGIASEDVENVFRPFFRTDRSRTRASGGVGLGLGLARRIAVAHGGRLELESELGVHTTVTIELPLDSVTLR